MYKNLIPRFSHNCLDISKVTVQLKNFNLSKGLELFKNNGIIYIKDSNLDNKQTNELINNFIYNPMKYKGGANNRNKYEQNFYDVGAPVESTIHYHHEMTYINKPPSMIAFTSLNNVNNDYTCVSSQELITKELLKTNFGKKLKKEGIIYTRCLTDERKYLDINSNNIYNHWQNSFNSTYSDIVSRRAKDLGLEIEWGVDYNNNKNYLITKYITDAFEYCPEIDKNLLFSSLADHNIWFDDWEGLKDIPHKLRPLKMTFGNGDEITNQEMRLWLDLYDKYGSCIKWKKGDILILCNHRWAHGRPPIKLDENEKKEDRKLGVVLGNEFKRVGQLEGKWI